MNPSTPRVIHLVSDVSRINFGVWNVVLATFPYLEQLGWQPEIWFPETDEDIPEEIKRWEYKKIAIRDSRFAIRESNKVSNSNKVFVSHGTWSFATKLGHLAKKSGHPWIAVPHGMLEPWPMQQKWLKKKLYFEFFEKPKLKQADALIAVGYPEFLNLKKQFSNVHHIPNGIEPNSHECTNEKLDSSTNTQLYKSIVPESAQNPSTRPPVHPLTFLFLSRLHHKKGPLPLARAWLSSKLHDDDRYQLILAGPDEGERSSIELEIGSASSFELRASNIKLPGPVYDTDKQDLLLNSTFFLLPSQSEGFPTTILEAMTHGCIPVFTEGCNFPEALEAGVGVKIEYDEEDIREKLEELAGWSPDKRIDFATRAKAFVDQNYNWKDIAKRQVELYDKIINHNSR